MTPFAAMLLCFVALVALSFPLAFSMLLACALYLVELLCGFKLLFLLDCIFFSGVGSSSKSSSLSTTAFRDGAGAGTSQAQCSAKGARR